nr:hypothetical protein [Mycobacterium tuberculosis]
MQQPATVTVGGLDQFTSKSGNGIRWPAASRAATGRCNNRQRLPSVGLISSRQSRSGVAPCAGVGSRRHRLSPPSPAAPLEAGLPACWQSRGSHPAPASGLAVTG